MNKTRKVLVGIATVWPISYMVIFMVYAISQFFLPTSKEAIINRLNSPPTDFFILFGLHLFTMLLMIGLLIFYITNVFRNDMVTKDKKILWVVLLIFGNMIAMPIYWYIYIWKEPEINVGK